MTLRDYLVGKINEVADSWSDREHGLKTRTPEDEDDLLRVEGMSLAANIIMSIDLYQLDKDILEEE